MKTKLIMLLMTVGVLFAPATSISAAQANTSGDVTYVETTAEQLNDEEWVKANDPLYEKYNSPKTNDLDSKVQLQKASKEPWKNLKHDPRFEGCKKINGIDVSKWQKDIDWEQVKADGIDFAIIRLGFRAQDKGTLTLDEYFYENLEGAYDAGLKVGVYFYTQAITKKEAKAEAQFCVKHLEGYEDYLSFPVMYDIENTATDRMGKAKVTTSQRTAFCKAFCDEAIASGYKSGVYASLYYFKDNLNPETFSTEYHNWLARYATEYNASGIAYNGAYEIWQYSSTGKVAGIVGNVDMDVYYQGTPGIVADVSVVESTENSIQIKWAGQEAVGGYEVNLYDENDVLIFTYNTLETQMLLQGLAAGTTYKVNVRAYYVGDEIIYGNYSDLISITTKPAQVTNLEMTASYKTKLKLKWEPVVGATGYNIYLYSPSQKSYILVGTTEDNVYKSTGLTKKTKYKYRVEAYKYLNGVQYIGAKSEAFQVATATDKVEGIKVYKQTDSSVKVTWTKQKKVSAYEVSCYSKSGQLISVAYTNGNTNKLKYKNLDSGKTYVFKVRSYIASTGGKMSPGAFSSGAKTTTRPAKVATLRARKVSKNSITLTWDKVAGATGYKIYAYNEKTKRLTLLNTTKALSYKLTRLAVASKYSYKVLAYRKFEKIQYYGELSDAVKIATAPGKVLNLKQTERTSRTISLTWDKVTRASKYRVYRYDMDDNLLASFDVKTNSFVDTKLEAGKYVYRVRAIIATKDFESLGEYSEDIDACTKPWKVSGITIESDEAGYTVKWDKQKGVSGYEIYLYDEEEDDFIKVATTKSAKYILEDIEEGTAITVKVRAYIKFGKEYYYGKLSDECTYEANESAY